MPKPSQTPELVTEAIAKALEIAPEYAQRTHVSRAVNAEIGVDWTDSQWRSIWKINPGDRYLVDKRLGTGRVVHDRVVNLGTGNVRGLAVYDAHAPFQDDNAIALVCKVIRHIRPDVLIFGGDDTDFYNISRFDKNPGRRFSTQDEVDATQARVLVPLTAAMPRDSRKFKVLGNHCIRLERYLWTHPELFSVKALTLPALLELDKIGIEYVPYAVEFGNLLHATHGTKVSVHAGYAAKAELVKRFYQTSTMTGHNHRNGKHQGNHRGRAVVGQEVACLCHTQPEYQDDPNWSQGFALFEIRNGNLRIEHVDIHEDYTCYAAGRWFDID